MPLIEFEGKSYAVNEDGFLDDFNLFPSDPAKGACKMAGLPKPTGCI